LGDYVSLVRGTTYKGNLVGKPGPALLGLGSITPGGGFREEDFKTYGGDCPEKLMLVPGDLFASLKGATKDGKMIGSVARVPTSVPLGRLTQDTVKLCFKRGNQEVESYIYWLLQTPEYRAYCAGRAMGSAVVALSREDFLSYPVPELSHARRAVVDLLETIESRMRLLRQTNATLEAIAQALFKSWFVDFDPVRAKMAGRAPEGTDEATAALFPDALEETALGLVPKGWSVKTLADVTAYLNRGISPKYVDDGGLLVLNQKCVRDFSIDWSKGRRHDPNQRKVDGRLLEKGDVLVNSTGVGTLGRVGQILSLPEPAIVDSHVTVVRAGEAVTWSYLGQWMQSRQEQIEAMGEGSTGQTELSRSKLGGMPLLVPARAALAAFDKAVLPLKARISCNADTAQSLSSLRDVLLPRLISGQLRLPEAQAQLEKALA
jgi:restriction endonuclease S subunit